MAANPFTTSISTYSGLSALASKAAGQIIGEGHTNELNELAKRFNSWVQGGAEMAAGVQLAVTGLKVTEALNHDGTTAGFYGATPVAQAAAYTPGNVTPTRTYDADATSTAELADVLGTLIADLQALGLVG